MDVTTSFIKTPDGKSWGVRVDGAPKRRATKTAVIFHLALEDMPDPSAAESPTKYVRCEPADTPAGNDQVIAVCTGEDPSLGGFEIQVINVAQGNIVEGPAIKSIQVPESSTWQAKCKVFLRATSAENHLTCTHSRAHESDQSRI